MSVYLKIIKVRNELRKKDLKKSGENKFSKYKYYELGDFLPSITELCEQEKLCSFINFSDDEAILTIIDAEKPDAILEFKSPIAQAQLKGCHDVQNLGAVQTYLRRYLYMNAFEIVESDVLDENAGNSEVTPETATRKLSQKQINRMLAIGSKAGYSESDIKLIIKKKYNIEHKDQLSKTQYHDVCEGMEKNPKGDK